MYANSYDDLEKLINSTGSILLSVRKHKTPKDILVKKIKSDIQFLQNSNNENLIFGVIFPINLIINTQ